MSDFYNGWIAHQAEAVEAAMRNLGRHGVFTAAVYVIPSNGMKEGALVVATEQVAGAHSVVRFPAQGSNVMAVPYPHLASLLWNACRSVPILPVRA